MLEKVVFFGCNVCEEGLRFNGELVLWTVSKVAFCEHL